MGNILTHAMGQPAPKEREHYELLRDRISAICIDIPARVEAAREYIAKYPNHDDFWFRIMQVIPDDVLDSEAANILEEGFYEMGVETSFQDVGGRALYVRAGQFVAAALVERKKNEDAYAEMMKSR